MNYLAYQPAFDVFHAGFRLLRLSRLLRSDRLKHFDQIRIVDFYLLFPFRLQDVRFKPGDRKFKTAALKLDSTRYEKQPSDDLLFARMKPIQWAAAETLVANGYFDKDAFSIRLIKPIKMDDSSELSAQIDKANLNQETLMKALEILLGNYDLLGPDGLKDRTGLLEFRYDPT